MYSNRKRIAAAENELKAIVEEDQQIKREERGEEEAVSDTATDVSIYSSSDDESVGSMCDEQVTNMSCTIFWNICSMSKSLHGLKLIWPGRLSVYDVSLSVYWTTYS